MSDIRSKALGYLRDGKVSILYARTARSEGTPARIVARVEGHHGRYVIDLQDGQWRCTAQPCLVRQPGQLPCAHIAAVQLITGHQSVAAKPVRIAS